MRYEKYNPGEIIVMRADHGADLVDSVEKLAKEEGIKAGIFTAMGALKRSKLSFYDQDNHKYQEIKFEKPCEIASCLGNISLLDGESFVHAHAVLADENGNTIGGHLSETEVFAAEIHIQVLKGPELERVPDEITELSLWDV